MLELGNTQRERQRERESEESGEGEVAVLLIHPEARAREGVEREQPWQLARSLQSEGARRPEACAPIPLLFLFPSS